MFFFQNKTNLEFIIFSDKRKKMFKKYMESYYKTFLKKIVLYRLKSQPKY